MAFDTIAPFLSAKFLASDLEILVSLPVKTILLPDTFPDCTGFSIGVGLMNDSNLCNSLIFTVFITCAAS